MSDNESAAEDRTEAPTEKRLNQAREDGRLPISRDLTMLASLGGAALGGIMVAPPVSHRLTVQAAGLLGMADRMHVDDGRLLGARLGDALFSAALLVGGVAVPAAVCAILAVLLQTGFYVGKTPIRFQPERLNPAAGLARLCSRQHLLDFLKSLGRLGLLCGLVWSVAGRKPAEAVATIGSDAMEMLAATGSQVQHLVRPLLLILACFAALDVFLVRSQHTRSMRMTREQVRLEMRDAEGDPFIKGKLRRLRQQRSRKRMMAKVKTAAVVITNPTHYAIALHYELNGNAAPKVVAKGVDFVAARIREEAASHGIPMVPNPPLARILYQVELDREIPAEHFRAVAEVIAYVWKLKNQAVGRTRSGPARPGPASLTRLQ